MALLLKITDAAFGDGTAVVPRMKSATLSTDDVGAEVFVWRGAGPDEASALFGRAILASVDPITLPQARNPARQKDAYRLSLSDLETDVHTPLSTDDLGPYRYVEGVDGIESLGRLQKDRNDKIIRLTEAEAAVLRDRIS